MIVSTIFTLILIPAGFSLVMDAKVWLAKLATDARGLFARRPETAKPR